MSPISKNSEDSIRNLVSLALKVYDARPPAQRRSLFAVYADHIARICTPEQLAQWTKKLSKQATEVKK